MKEVLSVKWEVSRFEQVPYLSQSQSLPLFKTLKKVTKKGLSVGLQHRRSLTHAQSTYAALPTLVAPRPGEELIMYLSATHGAISAVLLTDRDSVQTPVYFVSKALKETEINYSAMEKLILALVLLTKNCADISKRRPNSGNHKIKHTIKQTMQTAVKGKDRYLADFLIERTETDDVLPPERSKNPITNDLIHRMDRHAWTVGARPHPH
ncbi:reverse transcriptase domain-containing protein [Tanacetum coccineum]